MAKAKWNVFGVQHSTAAAAAAIPIATTIPASKLPPGAPSADAKKFGLENFGNTCYANSVIQALYFCTPFRDLVLQSPDHLPPSSAVAYPTRKPERKVSTSLDAPPVPPLPHIPSSPPTLFSALRSLFLYISSHPADKGTVAPRAFIDKLREVTELFRSTMHQDAHEFLNYLLNKIVEEVEEERKLLQNATPPEDMSNSITTLASQQPPTIITATTSSNSGTSPQDATLVHRLFEGVLTSETRCLTCETVSSRDESFLDLSIDIEQNSSVTACLRQFSASEMLCQRNKFFCDSCCDLQEAEKRMKIKKLPNVLALHLKRFKYQEDVQRYIKLAYRVAFPFELRLFNTVDDMDDADRLYNLFGIVVHIGNGPHHGHYVSIIKTLGTWLVFDDDNVYPISENDIPKYFGDSNSGSAYVLYYQAADIDLAGLGLHIPSTPPVFPEAEAVVHVHPSIPGSPAPAMPPGLVHEEGDISDLSDPPFPATPSPAVPMLLHVSPEREKAANLHAEGKTSAAGSDLGDSSSASAQGLGISISGAGNSSPVIPSKAGKTPRLFTNMRRTPSLSTRRNDEAAAGTLGVDGRRSFAERTSRATASSPALSSGHADETEDSPAPLPPPVPPIHGEGKGKEREKGDKMKDKDKSKDKARKEKDPDRKPSTWFGKRKSFKLGDKPRAEGSLLDLPSSPQVHSSAHSRAATTGDEAQSSSSSPNWHVPTHPASAEKSRQPSEPGPTLDHPNPAQHPTIRPKSSIGALLGISHRDHRRSNGYETPSAGSATSSMASISHRESAPLPPPPSLPHSSVSTPASPTKQESLPPRKSSLAASKAFQQISSSHIFSQHKKSLSGLRDELGAPLPPRPMTADAPSDISESLRPLPPVPPMPPNLRRASHDAQRSNGYHTATPAVVNGDTHKITRRPNPEPEPGTLELSELDATPEMRKSFSAASSGSPGLASFSGAANHSATSSSTTASSGAKRAGRKLSLSTPMKLGFGRKDKEKEKEGGHEREKHKAPSAFAHSFSRF